MVLGRLQVWFQAVTGQFLSGSLSLAIAKLFSTIEKLSMPAIGQLKPHHFQNVLDYYNYALNCRVEDLSEQQRRHFFLKVGQFRFFCDKTKQNTLIYRGRVLNAESAAIVHAARERMKAHKRRWREQCVE